MQLQELINFMCTFPRFHTDCMFYIPAYNACSYAFAIVVQIILLCMFAHIPRKDNTEMVHIARVL